MKTTSQLGLPGHISVLLFLLSCLAVSHGHATDSAAVPPDVSAPQAIVSEARLSLAEARKTQSNPRIAVGHYLDAADAAVWSVGRSPGNEVTEEARSIYNAACQEVGVLLRSSAELWNRTETIPSRQGTYQLRFAPGSRKEGTWDPAYCDFFRTPKQVHEKIAHQEARINDWGGVLVGVYKPSDPRKQFLPLVGLAAALAKEKYVFCEKPIDENLEKAKRFVYEDSARAAKIMIGFHRRFDQTHRHLRETIHSGTLGQVEQIVINSRDPAMESYDVLSFTGGIFRDMTMHDIDQASILLGAAKVTGVFARTACLVDPAFAQRGDFDNAVAIFWAETGATCTIVNSRRSAFGFEQNIEVFCSKGSASLNTPAGMTFTIRDQRGTHAPAPAGHFRQRCHLAYETECQAFLETIEHGKEFPVSALDGLNALRLADAADRSARLGQPVAIDD
jgi:myo-inositol 2-dehydrogenase / D-chiro-inositol 1-dehydrogenase